MWLEVELFGVLVVRFVLSFTVWYHNFDISVRPWKIIWIVKSSFSWTYHNIMVLWNWRVIFSWNFHGISFFMVSVRNITIKSHNLKSRGFHRTMKIHRPFTEFTRSIVTLVKPLSQTVWLLLFWLFTVHMCPEGTLSQMACPKSFCRCCSIKNIIRILWRNKIDKHMGCAMWQLCVY